MSTPGSCFGYMLEIKTSLSILKNSKVLYFGFICTHQSSDYNMVISMRRGLPCVDYSDYQVGCTTHYCKINWHASLKIFYEFGELKHDNYLLLGKLIKINFWFSKFL